MVFFLRFSELGCEGIVSFVDIGGIVDHHCLDFLFINFVLMQSQINISKFDKFVNILVQSVFVKDYFNI